MRKGRNHLQQLRNGSVDKCNSPNLLLTVSRAKLILLLALFSLSLSMADTHSVDHWETIVYSSDTWKYFVGHSEPALNWSALSFDDALWSQGPGGIGYGDDDDLTQIEASTSVYLRIQFDIVDLNQIKSAVLNVDYDDSFIAYINNVEVARAGISGDHPPHNQTADSNHEAQMPTGNPPEAFAIQADKLSTTIKEGENILALQVHNVSGSSSDLSSTTFLSLGLSDSFRHYRPVPDWFNEPFVFSSSDIPIMVIDTEGRHIVDEPKIMARMGIIDNGAGNRNSVTDAFNEYDGWIGIEYRGNASMNISDKKPFTFETRNEEGSDRNVEILGLPDEDDFILRAAYIDKTLMRDALAYHISRSIGRWAPRTRHVEVVLNGSYEGVYILEEKIKPDNNRLDITRMDSSDIAGEALTGGYIWSVQQSDENDVVFDRNEADGNKRVLKYPKPDEVTPEQLAYISRLEQDFCDVMYGPYYNDPALGYMSYIDVSSFIDEIIIQELTSNSDAYSWSGFLYKDRGEKINAGPAWDFDQALSNSTHNDGHRYNEWIIAKPDGYRPYFWDRLFAENDIQNALNTKWNVYRQDVLSNDRIFAFIDSVTNYLAEAQEHNFKKWPILGVPVWRSLPGVEFRNTYQREVDYMKDWLTNHLAWMDAQLVQKTSTVANKWVQNIDEFKLYPNYPNPFNPTTGIKYRIPESGLVTLKVFNSLGQEVAILVNEPKNAGEYVVNFDASNLAGGIYITEFQSGSILLIRKMLYMK
jgi:hypothetical protein